MVLVENTHGLIVGYFIDLVENTSLHNPHTNARESFVRLIARVTDSLATRIKPTWRIWPRGNKNKVTARQPEVMAEQTQPRKNIGVIKHYVYGKRQTVDSCVSQKPESVRFSTCLTLLISYSIYLVNRQERSLKKTFVKNVALIYILKKAFLL